MMGSPGTTHDVLPWSPSSSLNFLLQVQLQMKRQTDDATLTIVALLCCNLVCVPLLTCLWGDDAGATAPVGERDTSAFFFPHLENAQVARIARSWKLWYN